MLCIYGLWWKTCRWHGTRVDARWPSSGPNRAAEWLTWESERTGHSIRHQINGREKRIGKLPVDECCSQTKTAYHFHDCYYHGTFAPDKRWKPSTGNPWPNCSKEHHLPMSLCQGHRVVGVRVERHEKVSGCCLSSLTTGAVHDDITADPERRAYRNLIRYGWMRCSRTGSIACTHRLTCADFSPFMRRYDKEHNIMTRPCRLLMGNYRGVKDLLATPSCLGTWTTDSRWRGSTRLSSTLRSRASGGSAMRSSRLDGKGTSTHARPSSWTPWSYWGTRAKGKPSPTWNSIVA